MLLAANDQAKGRRLYAASLLSALLGSLSILVSQDFLVSDQSAGRRLADESARVASASSGAHQGSKGSLKRLSKYRPRFHLANMSIQSTALSHHASSLLC